MNAATKFLLDFKPTDFDKAIDMSDKRMKAQHDDLIRAFFSQGRWILAEEYKKYAVSEAVWSGMTSEQRDAHWKKFLQACRRKELIPKIQPSKDGNFFMREETAKRKLGQTFCCPSTQQASLYKEKKRRHV